MRLPKNILLAALVILIGLVVLKVTKAISAPILLALTFGVILSPLVDRAAQSRIPPAVMALSMTFGTVAGLIGTVLFFMPAIDDAVRQVPLVVDDIRRMLEGILAIGENIDEMSKEVKNAIGADNAGGGGGGGNGKDADLPSFMDAVLFAPQLAAQLLIFLGVLFFFILTRTEIYKWLGQHFAITSSGEETEALLHAADQSVSRYFVTITAINALLGIVVFCGLWSFGLPSPATWGFLAFLLNYLLYLGPALFACGLLVAGHLNFFGLYAYGPMVMFICFNFLEGYFVTPSLVGRRLTVNPLLIFIILTVWLWLWGPVGGIVALPVSVWLLVVTGQIAVTNRKNESAIEQLI
ncbi:MAG: AI-2E family transporter [Mangrovicoccus sp.]